MKDELQLEDFKLALLSIWKNKFYVILVTLIGGFAGLLLTVQSVDSSYYVASASVYSATYGSYELSLSDSDDMSNYSDIISSEKVCDYAASLISDSNITGTEIQQMISASISDSSYVMTISATSLDPELSVRVVNAVAEAFVAEIGNITGSENVQILDEANSCYQYQSNDVMKKRIMFPVAAFLLVAIFFAIRTLLSSKIHTISQCVEDEDEILGIIPLIK